MVENQTNKRVKKLITDNRLEFYNKEFYEFYAKSRIVGHRICAYTPQQNSVAERLNRVILDRVRCMLVEFG